MPEQRSATKPRFTVEHWAEFWADPLNAQDGQSLLAQDIVGYWPGESEPVRGLQNYYAKITKLLAAIPDLRLAVVDSATTGDLIFIHYVARGTGPSGPFEVHGIDRLVLRDGIVVENLIRYDTGAVSQVLAR